MNRKKKSAVQKSRMLKLNVNGQSFVVDGYTRSSIAQINFSSPLTTGEKSPVCLASLLNSKQTHRLAVHLSISNDCRYECEMTSFEPVYETFHASEDFKVAKFYDFSVGLGHGVVGCEQVDIELHPVRPGFFTGSLKSKVWFLIENQDTSSLTPPWSLVLEHYDQKSQKWSPLFNGWELRVDDDVNSQPLSLDGTVKGAQIVTPLTAILI